MMNRISRILVTAVLCSVGGYAGPALAGPVLYESNYGSGTINRIEADGSVSLVASIFAPQGLALDPAGNLYVANSFFQVSKIAPDGQVSTLATGLFDPRGLVYGPDGYLYVGDIGTGTISKIDPTTGDMTAFVENLNGPIALAFDKSGTLYEGNYYDGTINKVSSTGQLTPFLNVPLGQSSLAFDSLGNLFVVNGDATISKIDPSGQVSQFTSDLVGPQGIAFDSANNLYVADNPGGAIVMFTPDGVKSYVAQGLNQPTYVIVAPSAVPEPGSLTLVGLGVAAAGITGLRRRRSRRGVQRLRTTRDPVS